MDLGLGCTTIERALWLFGGLGHELYIPKVLWQHAMKRYICKVIAPILFTWHHGSSSPLSQYCGNWKRGTAYLKELKWFSSLILFKWNGLIFGSEWRLSSFQMSHLFWLNLTRDRFIGHKHGRQVCISLSQQRRLSLMKMDLKWNGERIWYSSVLNVGLYGSIRGVWQSHFMYMYLFQW